MSDEDLDDLFDEFDDDELSTIPESKEETKAGSPDQQINQPPASEDSPANVSASEEKLRSELEEMKRKMKMMEEMLQKQSMTTPVKSETARKTKTPERTIAKPRASEKMTPQKEVTPKKSSLSDKFKNILPSNSNTENKLQSTCKQTASKTPSKCQLSDTFGSALNQAAVKPPPAKQSSVKSVSITQTPDKLDKCPHSGIRIANRTIAKSDFNCAVATRRFIKIQHLPIHFKDKQEVAGDWVTSGAIVRKAGPFKSKTGNDYSIWTLSDLISLENTISLFLFKTVHLEHRKEQVGTVVSLLNPNFMPPRDQEKGKKSDLAFTLDNPEKLIRMGMAADYGTCKNITKGGQQCNNFINKALTQYCDFHIVKVHAQMRNKRIALNGSFTPQPGNSKVQKLKQECQAFTHKGNVYYPNAKPTQSKSFDEAVADKPEVTALKKKGMMISTPLVSSEEFNSRLKIQSSGSIQLKRALESSPKPSENTQTSKRAKLELTSCKTFFKKHIETPKLGSGASAGGFISLNTDKKKAAIKAKALSLARQGAFTAKNPNRKRHELTADERLRMKERSLGLEKEPPPKEEIVLNSASDMMCSKPIITKNSINSKHDKENKARKNNGQSKEPAPAVKKGILSAAFGNLDANSAEGKRLMKAQSMNVGVIREQEIERTTDYFNALEKFEYNEEKLMKIQEIKVTVYICKTCNTATSKQLPKCIEENHPVKKGPAVKKFFKCSHCSQRTDAVGLPYPDHNCMKCGKSAWVKCSMYHEKKGPKLESERLVVRAEDIEIQEKFK